MLFYINISWSALLFPYVANYVFLFFIMILSNITLNIFSFYFSPLGLFFSIHPKSEIPKVRVNLSGFD